MSRAASKTSVGIAGQLVGDDPKCRHLGETSRHNHYQNKESAAMGAASDKDYGLSPARCKIDHNKQSVPVEPKPASWRSRINDTDPAFSLSFEPETAAKSMEQRSVKPDLVNKPQRGPIRFNGKGNTDAGIKFGNRMP
eukprot:TRINITY_DN5809_c0_g1_i1.p1 TRINITY_DN5809_c0_g1~~TRINITY_DN5809_c0_g1_i1.p1  ORF type:complete len:138 (+),score=14.35 TRINITY_DN5809_c0_g1_i1:51-464(+)